MNWMTRRADGGPRRIALTLACLLLAACGGEGGDGTGDGMDDPDRDATPEADAMPATDAMPEPTPDAMPAPERNACEPLAVHLDGPPPMGYAEDCAALAGADRFLCAESWFWLGLTFEVDLEQRRRAYAALTALIAVVDPLTEPTDLGRTYALRGQLALAMALENRDSTHLAQIDADFREAAALDPENAIIPTWKDSMDIALEWRLRGGVGLPALMERTWANVERCPTGNILSISGTTIGLPLSTGIPQDTIERLDAWACNGAGFCGQNTWRAPFAQPGLAYHFAEAYARVGRADDARQHLDAALAAPGGEAWPFRPMVQDTLDHFDDFVAEFTDLGDEGDAFDRMYANQEFGCVFCHASDPPAHMVRTTRLTGSARDPDPMPEPEPEPMPEPEPEPMPEPEPEPEPAEGACTNPGDEGALAAAGDVQPIMTQCALSCFGQPPACGAGCVEEALGLSSACAGCFGEILACTLTHCAFQCAGGAGDACSMCQAQHCVPAFEACAGIAPL